MGLRSLRTVAAITLPYLPEPKGSKNLGETIFLWDHETQALESVADSLDAR